MKSILFIPFVLLISYVNAQPVVNYKEVPIAKKAIATLHLKGYPDFLAADIDGVWVTNENRIEKLVFGNKEPVLSIAIPQPCGAMAIGCGIAMERTGSLFPKTSFSTRFSLVTQTPSISAARKSG